MFIMNKSNFNLGAAPTFIWSFINIWFEFKIDNYAQLTILNILNNSHKIDKNSLFIYQYKKPLDLTNK